MKKTMLIVCALLLSQLAKAGMVDDAVKRGTLKVGSAPIYMPFQFSDKKGQVIGFEIDIAKEMAKAMDVKLEVVSTDYDGIIPALQTGKFDIIMSAMTVTQKRNLQVNFAMPFIEVGQTIIVRKEIADQIKTYKDLNDSKYKVTSALGTSGEATIKRVLPKATYTSYENAQLALLDIINGRADALVYDSALNEIAISKYGSDKLVHIDTKFTYEPLAWAIKKGDYDSINWLNNFLIQIKNDGTYDRIYKKWFENTAWLKEVE